MSIISSIISVIVLISTLLSNVAGQQGFLTPKFSSGTTEKADSVVTAEAVKRIDSSVDKLLEDDTTFIEMTEEGPQEIHIDGHIFSMLVLESMERFISDPNNFGIIPGTFDNVLSKAGVFQQYVSTPRAKDVASLVIAHYDQVTQEEQKADQGYLSQMAGTLPFTQVIEEAASLAGYSTEPASVATTTSSQVDLNIKATVDMIECIDTEELEYRVFPNSGDEIYFTVFGAVFSQDGILYSNSQVSDVTEYVGNTYGDSPFPNISSNCNPIIDYHLNQPNDKPYYLLYSITLWEQEHSDAEKRQALKDLVGDTYDLIKDAVCGNYYWAAYDLAYVIYDLAIALDEDDLLGSVSMQINDFTKLTPQNIANIFPRHLQGVVSGYNWGNYYEYNVSHTLNITCKPVPPSVTVSPPANIKMNSALLNGNITSLGTAGSAQVSFEYGINKEYNSPDSPVSAGTMYWAGPFAAGVTNLAPSTTYYFRAKVDGGPLSGISYSDPITFTTLPSPLVFTEDKLTAKDALSNSFFGSAVAVDGDTMIVGAQGKNSNTGAAYIFTLTKGSWTQQGNPLSAGDPAQGDYFGCAVSINGDTAIVGAYGKAGNAGVAYVFSRNNSGKWSLQDRLTAGDPAANDYFGCSVSVYGDTAIVGAYGKAGNTGVAYVFVRNSKGVWSQQDRLTPIDAVAGDRFGMGVAVWGDTVLVGAHGKANATGAAYIFTRSKTTWYRGPKLTASDAAEFATFGYSVSLCDSRAIVGATTANNRAGEAYIFKRDSNGEWIQQGNPLRAGDAAPDDRFGISVYIYSNVAVIGAYNKNNAMGAAYIFTCDITQGGVIWGEDQGVYFVDGNWDQRATLTASDGVKLNQFGIAVSCCGATGGLGYYNVAVAAWGKNSNAGGMYIFNNMPIPATYTLTVSVSSPAAQAAGCNVTGNFGAYQVGSKVSLTAKPAAGWQFVNWTGSYVTNSTILNFAMPNNNISLVANFAPDIYTINTSVSSLAAQAAGCNVTGNSGSYQPGSLVTITSKPATGWQFDSWTGSYTGSSPILNFVMPTNNISLVANFSQIPQYSLTINTSGQGTVIGAGSYDSGTVANITATPAAGWQFVNWSGDAVASATSASTTITMSSNKTVTASFSQIPENQYSLIINTSGSGTTTGAGAYKEGTIANISATPAAGWQFVNWSGDAVSNSTLASTTISMNSNKAVTANFSQIPGTQYALTVHTSGNGTAAATVAGPYDSGARVTITATPAAGWQFVNWTGDAVASSSSANTTITMNGNRNITANFTQMSSTTTQPVISGTTQCIPNLTNQPYIYSTTQSSAATTTAATTPLASESGGGAKSGTLIYVWILLAVGALVALTGTGVVISKRKTVSGGFAAKPPKPEKVATRLSTQFGGQPDYAEMLTELAELKKQGVFTEEEFATKKKELLDKMINS